MKQAHPFEKQKASLVKEVIFLNHSTKMKFKMLALHKQKASLVKEVIFLTHSTKMKFKMLALHKQKASLVKEVIFLTHSTKMKFKMLALHNVLFLLIFMCSVFISFFVFPKQSLAIQPENSLHFEYVLEDVAEQIALKVRANPKPVKVAVIDVFNQETQERDATTALIEEQLTKKLIEILHEQVISNIEIVRLRLEWKHTFPDIQHDPLAENVAKLVNADWMVTGNHQTSQNLLSLQLQLYELAGGTLIWQTTVESDASSNQTGVIAKKLETLNTNEIGEKRTDISFQTNDSPLSAVPASDSPLSTAPISPFSQEISPLENTAAEFRDKPKQEENFWSSMFRKPAEEEDYSTPENMVLISEGEFLMGATNGESNEIPDHLVFIRSFFLDKYEVSNAEFSECTHCIRGKGGFDTTDPKQPVVYVDWKNAQAYCEAKKKRLPTEAEWEFAVRVGDKYEYSFGDSIQMLDGYAWTKTNTIDKGVWAAQKVGTKRSNKWGLFDMHGNVMEWVSDYYAPNYFASVRQPLDPKGPSLPEEEDYPLRVVRGGAWGILHGTGSPSGVRSAKRYAFAEWTRSFQIGFRCAQDLISKQ